MGPRLSIFLSLTPSYPFTINLKIAFTYFFIYYIILLHYT